MQERHLKTPITMSFISDIVEMLAGTNKDDFCDPNLECAACLALKPAATPTQTPTPTAKPTTTPAPAPTPKPTAEPEPTATPEPPGFEAVFANFSFQKEKFIKENIVGSFGKAFLSKKRFAVAYLVVRRKK